MRLRAVNVAGPGLPSDTIILTPGLAPPADLRAAVDGSSVTFAWTPPSTSVVPTGYMLEGGLTPGEVLARLPSPGTGTIITLTAPAGVFHVRVRATLGLAESEPSPEIQVNVGVDGPPSPPIGLLGLADGDFLALAWQNTFAGGAPSGIVSRCEWRSIGTPPVAAHRPVLVLGSAAGHLHLRASSVQHLWGEQSVKCCHVDLPRHVLTADDASHTSRRRTAATPSSCAGHLPQAAPHRRATCCL